MKSILFPILLCSFLFTISLCQMKEMKVNQEEYTEKVQEQKYNIYYKVSLDATASSVYKFIKIFVEPNQEQGKAYLYASTTDDAPRATVFDVSSSNPGSNILYIPRTYFEKTTQDYFYLNVFCEGYCDFNISFQQVEMMTIDRSKRLDFLTFDYEDYLIRFEKSEDLSTQLMVTASGGAKGHHGTKNNVKLNLHYYSIDDHSNTPIDVNSDTMFNGAGYTFIESQYSKDGAGYYLAKVRGPENTYINFMVRQIGISCDLPVDSKAIYGFLQGDDIDTFEITNHGVDPDTNDDEEQYFQVSIVVKGDLTISKSTEELCDIEEETISVNIKDELQAIITFNSTEIKEGWTHICIQGMNQYVKSNAYIIEVHNITDQKKSTIVTEPLVNGYIYTDYLKQDEVRSYRHSKYIGEYDTKYNVKLLEGLIKVAYVKCTTFPTCIFDKDVINGLKPEQYVPVIMSSIDNYYTAHIPKSLETNAYGPTQYLLSVLCLTEKCKFECSFADEEDSLVLREDSRIAHYISPTSTNYYHFKISSNREAEKVIVYLRTFAGDSNINICDDAKEQKRYYIENTEVLEFYDYQFTGLYTLNVTSSIGSFYLLSYSIIKPNEDEEEKVNDIGLGVSIAENIKLGHKKKMFSMFHDKTRGAELAYVANFYPVNCKIKVTFFGEEVPSINNIYQQEIDSDNPYYNEDYFNYQVDFISFNDDSTYPDKMCIFYISSQEISSNSQATISEGTNIGFSLTSKTTSPTFLYPHSAGESDILIKYNLENNYLVEMQIKIDSHIQSSVYFSRSSSYVIPSKDIKEFCPVDQVCGISLRFSSVNSFNNINKNDDVEIPIRFLVKSKDNVPSTLSKNVLEIDLVAQNSTKYYLVDISPEDKGDIVINFKKGSGIMFAKMVGKDADPEENPDWNNKVKLPTPEEHSPTVSEFDFYTHSIHYDASKLYQYGIPICQNGCELYIGIISTDEIIEDQKDDDYLEYSIYVRPEVNTTSSDPDEHQKLIKQAMVDIPSNEYVAGSIESSDDVHYFYFDVTNDCDSIEFEFQSESCSLYINEGEKYPDPGNSQWEVESKLSNIIFTIRKEDIGVDNLKGHEFKMAVNSKKYDKLLSMMYIFRIRVPKRTMKTITEINSNLDTVCDIKEENSYCDLVYPLSDYEYNSGSSLFLYAESEVISEIEIYYNPVKSYEFDNMNEEEIQKIIPRNGNSKKSTINQNIKNYIEISYDDYHPEEFSDIKPFALISIKSSKIGIINIYTSMREQVVTTSLNPFSYLLFNREKNVINFYTKGDQSYTFHITCIDGEGELYFKSQEDQEESHKTISGSGSLVSLTLPEKKEDYLIVVPNTEKGLKFYINENIHPELRTMDLIKFGFSGRLSYQNNLNFPFIYYMKIQDEDESINVNLHLSKIESSFNPFDGGNYTDVFDIIGYVVDENMITSMMRSKRIFPPQDDAINGRYDKAITTAKLYITSEQIKNYKTDSVKYVVISLNKNSHLESNIDSMIVDVSIMPFSNKAYFSPYNLYISGNLIKNESAPMCNYHRLRAGNQEDKYMMIEYGILSERTKVNIKDLNDKEIKFVEKYKEKGKFISTIELKEDNNILLEFCKDEKIPLEKERKSNYIFKTKSNTENKFKNFSLKVNEISYKFNYNIKGSNIVLYIPKILNAEGTKAVAATYTIRIFYKSDFEKDENAETISFISYYPYASYIHKIYANSEDSKTSPITRKILDYPNSGEYIVSVIGVTEENEEIFAYQVIDNPFKMGGDEINGVYVAFIVILIVFIIVVVAVFGYFIFKMIKRKQKLDEDIQKISLKISRNDGSLAGQNSDPSNEPFIKGSRDI